MDAFGTAKDFPFVAITYRLTEHFHYWTKHTSSSSELQSNFFVEVPEGWPRRRASEWDEGACLLGARQRVEGPALVTKRLRTLKVSGRKVYQIGLPIHWGFVGKVHRSADQ
jgi:anaerobic selenocysteine-containing dehydrogenase